MGDRLRLTPRQRKRLRELSTGPDSRPRTRTRALVILLTDQGQSGLAIEKLLGITRRTVSTTRGRWRREGLAGLQDHPHPGRPPRADAHYLSKLENALEQGPRRCGYAFARWTAPRLAAHLERHTGVHLSAARVLALLHSQDYVWRRTKRTLRNLQDPQELEQAHGRLEALKKGLSCQMLSMSCGSLTE